MFESMSLEEGGQFQMSFETKSRRECQYPIIWNLKTEGIKQVRNQTIKGVQAISDSIKIGKSPQKARSGIKIESNNIPKTQIKWHEYERINIS